MLQTLNSLPTNGTIIHNALVFIQNHKKNRREDDSNKTQVKKNNHWLNDNWNILNFRETIIYLIMTNGTKNVCLWVTLNVEKKFLI